MDILKKMFEKKDPEPQNPINDQFRKPPWSDEVEADDELFGDRKFTAFQIFTNPLELQKHFDRQMEEIMKTLPEFEENSEMFEKNYKEEYLKPGFEHNFFNEFRNQITDTDLDGEIYADQLHSLMQRLTPDGHNKMLPRNDNNKPKMIPPKKSLTDEEKIMGKIHGSILDDDDEKFMKKRKDILIPKLPSQFKGGNVFDGTYQGPKMFGQSVITQTLRKPDGTYETKRIIKDSDGNIKTTLTRTKEGKSETITSYSNENNNKHNNNNGPPIFNENYDQMSASDRNIYVSKEGYALPKNFW